MEPEDLVAGLVGWLNARLAPAGVEIGPETPLFATRLIDSLRILELIAWTERAIGREIPDAMISMDNFQTAGRIAEVFLGGRPPAEAPDVAA